MIRPYHPSDLSAVLTLINADQIPFQPFVNETLFAKALIGDADIDKGWWDNLASIETLVYEEDGMVVGAAAYGIHKTENNGYVLWLHVREQQRIISKLLTYMIQHMNECPSIYAFWFATPLTWGIEGLPKKYRAKTHQALARHGFASEDMWLYMAGSVSGPRKNEESIEPRSRATVKKDKESRGYALTIPFPRETTTETPESHKEGVMAEAEIGMVGAGVGALWWISVNPDYRGRGLGRKILRQCMEILTRDEAHSMILYVDHDDPKERDRRPAISMYKSVGFHEVDHLWSYERKKQP